jgi:HAD superfamily hydrolase (TIGR01509 family)
MIKALIWDIGGVLVKLEDLTPHGHWENRLGLPAGQLAQVVFNNPLAGQALIGQVTETEFWQDVGRQLKLSEEETASLRLDFYKAAAWDASLLAFIKSLKPRYKMGIISGAMSDARQEVREHVSEDLFEVMLFSAEEGIQKPAPEIYRRALARLGVEAHEAIFIDDWLDSVEGARAVGLHAIHYTAGVDIYKEIERLLDQEHNRDNPTE